MTFNFLFVYIHITEVFSQFVFEKLPSHQVGNKNYEVSNNKTKIVLEWNLVRK